MTKRRLTKQQLSRIKKNQEQRVQDAKQQHQQTTTETDTAELAINSDTSHSGVIVSHYGQSLDVEDSSGNIIQCKARKNLQQVVCGDRVYWSLNADGSGIITALQDRDSFLTRSDFHGNIKAGAANVDQVVIICASEPEFRETLIDQYIIATELLGVTPVIVLNKIDLLNKSQIDELTSRLSIYSDIGYTLACISAKQHDKLNEFVSILKNKTSILVGQSGVGKSTIIKNLLPEETIEIGELSEASGKGKHTTTVSRLYHLPNDGNIIDSPGVRDFGLGKISQNDLFYGFIEFRPYLGTCKYKNCTHINEPHCGILNALAENKINQGRYDNFQQIFKNRFLS